MKRIIEYYQQENNASPRNVVTCCPNRLYPQERDWTCAIACIRTIISGITEDVPEEIDYIYMYNLQPGPLFSSDIQKAGMLKGFDTVFGCNVENKDVKLILDYLQSGYFVMLESLINYSHWMVLLGYFPIDYYNEEKSKFLMYDPYYDDVRLINVDEFLSMWIDGNYAVNGVKNDFIAVKKAREKLE